MNNAPQKLGIIFVFYNEGANVRFVVESMLFALRARPDIEATLILVDNGATDDTWQQMQTFGDHPAVVQARVDANVGFGGGVLEGLRRRGDCTHIAICDGDGQIDPDDVLRIYLETDWTRYAMAKAHRVRRPEGLFRRAASRLFNLIFALTLGTRSKDHTGKPKILKADLVPRLNLVSEDFFIDMEIVAKTEALAEPYKEVPTQYRPRHGGESKVHFGTGLSILLRSAAFRPVLRRFAKEAGR